MVGEETGRMLGVGTGIDVGREIGIAVGAGMGAALGTGTGADTGRAVCEVEGISDGLGTCVGEYDESLPQGSDTVSAALPIPRTKSSAFGEWLPLKPTKA